MAFKLWEGNNTTSIKLGLIEVWKKQILVEDWINLMLSTIIYKKKKKLFIGDDRDISKEDVEGLGFNMLFKNDEIARLVAKCAMAWNICVTSRL